MNGAASFSQRFGYMDTGRDHDKTIEIADEALDYFAAVGQMPFLDFLMDKNPVMRIGPPNLGNITRIAGTLMLSNQVRQGARTVAKPFLLQRNTSMLGLQTRIPISTQRSRTFCSTSSMPRTSTRISSTTASSWDICWLTFSPEPTPRQSRFAHYSTMPCATPRYTRRWRLRSSRPILLRLRRTAPLVHYHVSDFDGDQPHPDVETAELTDQSEIFKTSRLSFVKQ